MLEKSPVITNLKNHLLVATAEQNGTFFERAVIYVANQGNEGAMGFVINQPLTKLNFDDIARSMGIEEMLQASAYQSKPIIFRGGPVENTRGFVLHSPDYHLKSTIDITTDVALSAQVDIVNDIARGHGPRFTNFCLGYAGWDSGQLEDELHSNAWLIVPATPQLVFHTPPQQRYAAATELLGLNALNFPTTVGEA